MNAIEVKISQIKNLNLVYLYNIDNVFASEKNKKYLGLKVLYDNNQGYINLDYKDKSFASLVKKTISVYNQEKDNRDIILLGDMSKKMFSDEEILSNATKANEYSDEGIGLFNTSNEVIKSFKPYLYEILRHILEYVRQMDGIEILNISGFNKKYNVTYKVGEVTCTFPMILYICGCNKLCFRVGAIAGKNIDIEGYIVNDLDRVDAYFKTNDGKSYGFEVYDLKNYSVEKNVTIGNETIYHSTEIDTVTDEDIDLVKFYLSLFNIDFSGEIIKVSSNNFILGNKIKTASSDEAEVITNSAIQLFIEDTEVTLKYRASNIINKLKHLITIPLDEENYDISLRVKRVSGKNYIICELMQSKELGRKYDYVAFEVDDIDLHHPFVVKESVFFDGQTKSIYDLEKKLALQAKSKSDLKGGEY